MSFAAAPTKPLAGVDASPLERLEREEKVSREEEDELFSFDENCRKPFLQMFVFLTCVGSIVLALAQLIVEGNYSFSTVGLILVALAAAMLLLVSIWRSPSTPSPSPSSSTQIDIQHRKLVKVVFIYCCFVNAVLVMCVLTDTQHRDIYHWFLCIPLLFLYASGVRACVAALVFICVQTTILRYVRQTYDLTTLLPPTTIRHTVLGESFCDCWLFMLLTTLTACHHHARTRVLERLKIAVREKNATNAALRHATQAKSEFLANMSHELRTPMHGITAMSRELQDMLTPSTKASRAVSIISDCAEHLLSLVSDILDFERIESNQLQLEAIVFSIVAEVQRVIHLLQITADKKRVELRLKLAVSYPFHVGDSTRFRQVIFNLLSNALKFTPEGGSVTVTVCNDDQDHPDEIFVAVTDTGIGIKEESRKQLFAPFSQLDSSICRRFGGSGLGLAICRQLCRAMGGSIECESEPGHGSTFTCRFQLPVADDPLEVGRSPAVSPRSFGGASMAGQRSPGESTKADAEAKLAGMRVLLVEDNEVNQKVGKRMLTALGCTVTMANHGGDCMRLVEANWAKRGHSGFDVILMDCQMPVMDGFEATTRIRALEQEMAEKQAAKETTPIVALTASATKEYAERCRSVGMSDVLFKPLRREALAAALRRWLAAT